ncbi:hypothetical protein DFJ74DRAFT_134637 [Hyaloraphidium curvatum]|nr:hypothetical protein DFJ74DRAFT_134637 [Hyaloraphidium curvatum]
MMSAYKRSQTVIGGSLDRLGPQRPPLEHRLAPVPLDQHDPQLPDPLPALEHHHVQRRREEVGRAAEHAALEREPCRERAAVGQRGTVLPGGKRQRHVERAADLDVEGVGRVHRSGGERGVVGQPAVGGGCGRCGEQGHLRVLGTVRIRGRRRPRPPFALPIGTAGGRRRLERPRSLHPAPRRPGGAGGWRRRRHGRWIRRRGRRGGGGHGRVVEGPDHGRLQRARRQGRRQPAVDERRPRRDARRVVGRQPAQPPVRGEVPVDGGQRRRRPVRRRRGGHAGRVAPRRREHRRGVGLVRRRVQVRPRRGDGEPLGRRALLDVGRGRALVHGRGGAEELGQRLDKGEGVVALDHAGRVGYREQRCRRGEQRGLRRDGGRRRGGAAFARRRKPHDPDRRRGPLCRLGLPILGKPGRRAGRCARRRRRPGFSALGKRHRHLGRIPSLGLQSAAHLRVPRPLAPLAPPQNPYHHRHRRSGDPQRDAHHRAAGNPPRGAALGFERGNGRIGVHDPGDARARGAVAREGRRGDDDDDGFRVGFGFRSRGRGRGGGGRGGGRGRRARGGRARGRARSARAGYRNRRKGISSARRPDLWGARALGPGRLRPARRRQGRRCRQPRRSRNGGTIAARRNVSPAAGTPAIAPQRPSKPRPRRRRGPSATRHPGTARAPAKRCKEKGLTSSGSFRLARCPGRSVSMRGHNQGKGMRPT